MEIQEIIKNMTLEEKSHLVNGATFFGSYGIDRLGVPRMQLLDGATGMRTGRMPRSVSRSTQIRASRSI